MIDSKTNPQEREALAALMLSALGGESRLRIYRLLVRAGEGGLSVGVIQDQLGIAASTLSHHIAALKMAGLIVQRRDGRTIFNTANYENMNALLAYLTEECCADQQQETPNDNG
ncbi:ArsR/SmtB family transcription factor [Aestuariibius sp. HNIBRBA575]|uniref:ArsR/SmtB family transcription factor n=1 Tax=Aestuariibius sp. HNIBRBA575 TaxID=3233343 RepID=UPI0034A44305